MTYARRSALLVHLTLPTVLALLALPLAVGACRPTPGSVTGDAKPTAISADELKARQDRIRSYFADRQARRDVVATTKTASGQVIDWIRPESQTKDGVIAKAPGEEGEPKPAPSARPSPAPKPAPGKLGADEAARTELQTQPEALGPAGTVPIVRFDVEAYLKSVAVPPSDPRDVLQKMEPPAPASNNRYYVTWMRNGDVFGTAGRINIWDPSGPSGDETSIAQTAVIRGDPMQAIEAGKIEYQGLNGDKTPHLFTFYRTSGKKTGDWVGGYNTLVDGWIQVSQTVAPGMSLAPWDSADGGKQYSLDLQVRIHQGNWWVKAAGEWAGYYPACSGGDAPPCDTANLFGAEGIRDHADRLDWYGEVFDESAPAATSTDMGSGAFADQWWQHAAYFRNVTFFWAPATYWWWDASTITPTDAACYSVDGPYTSEDASWRNWFFYGGPGKEARGCR